jgi:hypothetical protein
MIRQFFLQDCDETTPSKRSAVSHVNPSHHSPSHHARSPGSRCPPRTSSVPRISPHRPRRSVNASERIRDSSSSAQGITRFFRVPTRSLKASSPRSTAVGQPPSASAWSPERHSRRGPALRTIQQRPLGFNDACAVAKGGLRSQSGVDLLIATSAASEAVGAGRDGERPPRRATRESRPGDRDARRDATAGL